MQSRFLGVPDEQILPNISDSTGGQCGPIAFEIINSSDYLPSFVLENDTLVLESFSNEEVGIQEPKISAYLVDYPEIQTEANLKAIINPCTVDDFTVTQPSITYVVGSGQKQAEAFIVESEPAGCSYTPEIAFD